MATDTGASDPLLDSEIAVNLATVQQAPRAQYAPAGLHLGGGGGSYSFSPEEMTDLISQWQHILDRARGYDTYIHEVAATASAAADTASTTFTSRVQNAGADLLASHQSLKSYAEGYIARLKQSLAAYQNTEQSATDGIHAAAEGLDR